jgi:hypothetical protein
LAGSLDEGRLHGRLSGFLKSRVYAKLLMPLILERYQTFNGQPNEGRIGECMISKPTN